MRYVYRPLIVIVAELPNGFTPTSYAAINSSIISVRPAYSEHLPPALWIVCFKPRSESRARSLLQSWTSVRIANAELANLKFGGAIGQVVFPINWLGRILDLPLGDTVNIALRRASANAGDTAT